MKFQESIDDATDKSDELNHLDSQLENQTSWRNANAWATVGLVALDAIYLAVGYDDRTYEINSDIAAVLTLLAVHAGGRTAINVLDIIGIKGIIDQQKQGYD